MPYAPIFCFCGMILMLLFYIQSIEKQVSQDPLTGLNNRGQLTRYMAQRSGQRGEKGAAAVVMTDIDRLIGGIRGEIDRALPYPIRISAGHAPQAEGQSLQDCIQRADRQLYLDKARRTRSGLRSA